MFGNIKHFINNVQHGIVNSDLVHSFQDLHTSIKVNREKLNPALHEKCNYSAGSKLLDKHQQQWAEMHENADRNAKAAEDVDSIIIELHEEANSRLIHAVDLAQSLANLPKLSAAVEDCIEGLQEVQTLLKVVEEELVDLEDIVEKSNMAQRKILHHRQFNLYKENKLAALESIRGKLSKENTEQNIERDKQRLTELQAQNEASTAAFQMDMDQYRATGKLPIVNVPPSQNLTLEQVQLDDDREDLDEFLNS